MEAAYFQNIKSLSTDTLFRTDRKVEYEIANATLSSRKKQSILKEKYGNFSSNFGAALHTIVWTRLEIGHSMERLVCFRRCSVN